MKLWSVQGNKTPIEILDWTNWESRIAKMLSSLLIFSDNYWLQTLSSCIQTFCIINFCDGNSQRALHKHCGQQYFHRTIRAAFNDNSTYSHVDKVVYRKLDILHIPLGLVVRSLYSRQIGEGVQVVSVHHPMLKPNNLSRSGVLTAG